MRVRHLSTYLCEQNLLRTGQLRTLQGMRLGIDAVHWARTLHGLKDPLAETLCGLPPAMFEVLDAELDNFAKNEIEPSFVFQGMQPRSHMLFSSQMYHQMDEGWRQVGNGNGVAAQAKFSQATSRVNANFIQSIFHYLKSKECDVLQAPYFSTAQLAHYVNEEYLDAVIGPPSMLLFGVPRVITNIDFEKRIFEFVELNVLLEFWGITAEQFLEACLLAGTEYCLTFPFLNLVQFHQGHANFTFGTAVEFIKQAPFSTYMSQFPSEEMKNDHLDGYCVCKTLISCSLVLASQDGSLTSLKRNDSLKADGKDSTIPPVPNDFHKIIGAKLPVHIYYLMAHGILSRKVPSVLALGEWLDYSHPPVDSVEYRELIIDLTPYRCKALGLLASKMKSFFKERPINFSRYSCTLNQHAVSETEAQLPDLVPGGRWVLGAKSVAEEMARQKCTKIDFRFCLEWHKDADSKGTPIFFPDEPQPVEKDMDLSSLLTAVHFGILESLNYFTANGGPTVFSSALSQSSVEPELMLFVLEMLKFGLLTGEPLESPHDRPYPDVPNLHKMSKSPDKKQYTLITRVFSLLPVKLKPNRLWSAPVDFDLAAYHSMVKLLKRSLRQISEAVLGERLLSNIEWVKLLPHNLLHPCEEGLLPTFPFPRNCLGILTGTMLEYSLTEDCKNRIDSKEPAWTQLEAFLRRNFVSIIDPIHEIIRGIDFWNSIIATLDYIGNSIDVSDFQIDLRNADRFLKRQIDTLDLHHHPEFIAHFGCH